MEVSNFSFIKVYQPKLFEFGESAEGYVFSDPQSAVIKLRCFAELFVTNIYRELSISSYGANKLVDRINNAAFQDAVEDCVVDKLEFIRLKGNKAAHAHANARAYEISSGDALQALKEAWFLAAWLYMSCHGGTVEDLPQYVVPTPDQSPLGALAKDKQALENALQQQAEALQSALQELSKLENEQARSLAELDAINQQVNQSKLVAVKSAGHQATERFDFESAATRENIRLEDTFAEYDLTNGQAELVSQLDQFLSSNNENVFLLKGYAGTGKTFITKGLTEYFRTVRRNYVLSAPTGKAAKVISNKTQSPAYTIHKTIYSFKDMVEYRDDEVEGSETYKLYAKLAVNELSVDTVYIVDESSMISDVYNESEFFRCGSGHLLQDFLKFVNLDHNDHRKKVIFIGDDAQLPPVGMNRSPALDAGYLAREYGLTTTGYELTEVVRQKGGSGVMKNALKMRQALEDNLFNQLNFDLSLPDVQHVEHANLIETYLNSCDSKINAESIVIAHSNADVAAYNRRIREEFFPGQAEVCQKDKLMAVNNNDTYGFFISNGDFGQVRQVLGEPERLTRLVKRACKDTNQVVEVKVPLQFRDVELGFRDLDGSVCFFKAKIIETLLYSDDPGLSSDENKALYIDFRIRHQELKEGTLEFTETLRSDPYFNALRVKFGYAITCHKAQGSEWNHVFVKCKTHQNPRCAEYFRWLYTAITRTSNRLYVLEEPHFGIGSSAEVVSDPGLDLSYQMPTTETNMPQTNVVEPVETANHSSIPTGAVEDPTFGIPASNAFLSELLRLVKEALVDTAIEIYNIMHHRYQETYHFVRGSESVRVNIAYNGKCKIASISPVLDGPLALDLQPLLAPLLGRVISNIRASGSKSWDFEEPFLNELHLKIEQSVSPSDILITNVKEQNYSQRYWFEKDTEIAVLDVYYNKKKQITNYSPQKNLSNSNALISETLSIIQEGLS